MSALSTLIDLVHNMINIKRLKKIKISNWSKLINLPKIPILFEGLEVSAIIAKYSNFVIGGLSYI